MHVYEKVKTYIDYNGIMQVAVAEEAGTPIVTFNALLNGERTMYAEDLRTICYALNISAATFIESKST
ncbi:MAG: helix-turn-helix domain-containing protein [Synergistaceae bacterium]|nr:helix-turn-helix domain-containing protein [Synergistaceae bacterium]